MNKNLFLLLIVSSTIFCMDQGKPFPPDPPSGGSEDYSSGSDDETKENKNQRLQKLTKEIKLLNDEITYLKQENVSIKAELQDLSTLLTGVGITLHKGLGAIVTPRNECVQLIPETPKPKTSPLSARSPIPELTLLKPEKSTLPIAQLEKSDG